jgi:hypothetical protein
VLCVTVLYISDRVVLACIQCSVLFADVFVSLHVKMAAFGDSAPCNLLEIDLCVCVCVCVIEVRLGWVGFDWMSH